MSLDFNYEKCKPNEKEKFFSDNNQHLTNCIIHFCMFTGIQSITEKNVGEFFARVHFIESKDGAHRSSRADDGTKAEVFVTLEECRRYIGLSTNVSNETRKQFLTRYSTNWFNDCEREARQQAKELDTPQQAVA